MRANDRGTRKRWLLTGAAALAFVGVPVAVVVAESGDDDTGENGSREELRYAKPPPTSPIKTVLEGETEEGQPYVIRTYWSQQTPHGRELCVTVEYQGQPKRPDGRPLGLVGSKVCGVPDDQPLGSTMNETFVDPQTHQPYDTPRRFVYGFVADRAASVRVRAPNGNERVLKAATVPNANVQVFAGSGPRTGAGTGEILAKSGSGGSIAKQETKFSGFARQPLP